MRPATFRSSHTEKIADTSMKVIRATAAIKARMYGQYAARKSNTSTRSSEPESHEFGGCDGRYSIGGAKYRQAVAVSRPRRMLRARSASKGHPLLALRAPKEG